MARPPFRDRRSAGRELATLLLAFAGRPDVLVLGLARGGVPVGFEVAQALHVPLDVFVVRKIGAPGRPELAIGAVASGDVVVLNHDVIHAFDVTPDELRLVTDAERLEVDRRELAYRGGRAALPLPDKVIILVDDGLATGASLRAAIAAVRRRGAGHVVVAVPTAPVGGELALGDGVDEFVCVTRPSPFIAVSRSYRTFDQTSDEEVVELLHR